MGRKILLAVFGGIAVFGLMLAVVGFAMGGHPGSLTVEDDSLVFYEGGEGTHIARAPRWLSGMSLFNWDGRHWNRSTTTAEVMEAAEMPEQNAPFGQGQLKELELDISAGIVTVQTGNSYGLTVDGPLKYTSSFENGVWNITTESLNFSTRGNGWRFWFNGEDYTTTFIVTVPKSFDTLELSIGAGEATVSDLSLKDIDLHCDAGSLLVQNVTATESSFDVNAGSIDVYNFYGDDCSLDCDAGDITFEGTLSGELEAKCNMGNVAATLPKPADYGWKADVGLGSITIDGHESVGFSGNAEGGNQDASQYFDLKCDLGNIDIYFD